MQISVYNDHIYIQDPTIAVRTHLTQYLTYTDKSKEYQLKRMEKNRFMRGTYEYQKLQNEVHCSIMKETNNGDLIIPPGFHYLFSKNDYTDHRIDTGATISYPWEQKPFDLRSYQEEAVEQIEKNKRGLIVLATGLGKSLIAIHAVRRLQKKSLIICPNTAIADSFYKELCSCFGKQRVGYYGNGKKKIGDVTIAIIQSVNNHIEKFKAADLGLVILDECHRAPANTLFTVVKELGNVGRVFGMTATDFRSDGKDILINAAVGPTLINKNAIWGIANGWLAEPYFIVRQVDTVGRQWRDDKLKNYKEHVLNSNVMTDRIISDFRAFLNAGKNILCLVDEVAHGAAISKALGVPFATGVDKKSNSYIDQLNDGIINGLVATDSKCGEGVDTRRVDVLILANFVVSKGPLWQNIGRGLRLYENKRHVIILDYIPTGCDMLTRHAKKRLQYYKEITNNITVK